MLEFLLLIIAFPFIIFCVLVVIAMLIVISKPAWTGPEGIETPEAKKHRDYLYKLYSGYYEFREEEYRKDLHEVMEHSIGVPTKEDIKND